MKKELLIFTASISLAVSFTLTTAQGQNLVPNNSFELHDTCSPGQDIYVATGWKSYSGTPDYYNGCADSSTGMSVPYNLWGYKPAPDGIAYAGFYSYESTNANIREYVGRQLSAPLTIGNSYFVSFKVNPASNTYNINEWGVDCVNSGIGILFSTQPFPESTYLNTQVFPPPNRANVYSSAMVADTTNNWTTISGYFTADSAYQYFEIGTLFADSLISISINVASNPYSWHIAYYFVDEIIVTDSLTGIPGYGFSNRIFIYPNPFSTLTVLQTDGLFNNATLSLYNLFGQQVKQIKNISGQSATLFRDNLPSGLYFVSLTQNNKIFATDKLIITDN